MSKSPGIQIFVQTPQNWRTHWDNATTSISSSQHKTTLIVKPWSINDQSFVFLNQRVQNFVLIPLTSSCYQKQINPELESIKRSQSVQTSTKTKDANNQTKFITKEASNQACNQTKIQSRSVQTQTDPSETQPSTSASQISLTDDQVNEILKHFSLIRPSSPIA